MRTLLATPVPDADPATRRYLNRVWLAACLLLAALGGATTVSFFWPNDGSPDLVPAPTVHEVVEHFRGEGRPYLDPDRRFWLVPIDQTAGAGYYVGRGVASDGIMAISTAPVHPGDAVVYYCPTSGWFVGSYTQSMFNRRGERQPGGPAAHDLYRYRMSVDARGFVQVDASERVLVERPNRHPTLPDGDHCPFGGL